MLQVESHSKSIQLPYKGSTLSCSFMAKSEEATREKHANYRTEVSDNSSLHYSSAHYAAYHDKYHKGLSNAVIL